MVDDYVQRLKTQTKPLSKILKGDFQCSYLAAQHLREELWGIKMTGITMPAAREQCALIRYDTDTPSVPDTIKILVKPHSNMNIIRGSTNPYIGLKTTMRTKRSSLEVMTKDDMVNSLKKLLELLPWICGGGPNLRALMLTLIAEKTNISIEKLTDIGDVVVGGSVAHRLSDASRKGGTMINSLTTFNTHINVITDCLLRYAKSGKDYNICFQSVILLLIERIKTLGLTNDIEGRWGGLFTCCVEEVFEGDFEMTSSPQYPGVPLGEKVSEITVRNRRHGESNVVLSPSHATAVIYGIKWASHMGWRESRGVTPNFVNLTEFARMNFKTFIDMLATRLVYLSNGDRRYVLFRIYDAHDSHGISTLVRTLLQCGGFKAVGRLTGGAYPHDMDDASEIIRVEFAGYITLAGNQR